jgi:threonine synthase
LLKLSELGDDLSAKTIVCVLTANGLKDPGTAEKRALIELEYVEPDIESVMSALQGSN